MEYVSVSYENSIALITLNRPSAANALSIDLLKEYIAVLSDLEQQTQISVVILTGAGEKAFCAGADLKERKGMSISETKDTVALIGQAVQLTENIKQPVIAMLNGVAFGGGLELALACDLRIANQSTSMGLTEVSLGIIPGAGGTQRLPRLIGLSKAKELIYGAKRIDAVTALDLHLVDYVFDSESLVEETMKIAQAIAKNAPLSLIQAKKAIHLGMQVDLPTALEVEKEAYEKLLNTEDRLEGLIAFEEKRLPKYRGV